MVERMVYDKSQLRRIYDRTDGYCHICHRKLALKNYGVLDARGGWEVDHSRARANGGSNHGNNLYAACTSCNRQKSDHHTRTARSWNGTTRAPFSKAEKKAIRKERTAIGAFIGGCVGLIAGPAGMVIGAGLGGAIGNSVRPPKA